MAEDRIALLELLRNAGHEGGVDFLREGERALAQGLMELEVSGRIGAERYERTDGRTAHRNGYRERRWDTRVGSRVLEEHVSDGSRLGADVLGHVRQCRATVAGHRIGQGGQASAQCIQAALVQFDRCGPRFRFRLRSEPECPEGLRNLLPAAANGHVPCSGALDRKLGPHGAVYLAGRSPASLDQFGFAQPSGTVYAWWEPREHMDVRVFDAFRVHGVMLRRHPAQGTGLETHRSFQARDEAASERLPVSQVRPIRPGKTGRILGVRFGVQVWGRPG